MTQVIDKDALKSALRELIREEPTFIKDLVSEANEDSKDENDEEFNDALKKSFTRFEETYKALA